MGLPGVNVGPLDPDATSQFGQVSAHATARQLIRLHHQMNPPELRRELTRPLDPERTKALDYDEVQEYLDGLKHDNGDPLLPEGSELEGAAVRGEPRKGQVLTFAYRMGSGRIAKWFAPYGPDVLPDSFQAGAELSKVREMKDRGVVSFDAEGTQSELLRRRLAEVERENRALRKYAETGEGDEPAEGEEPEPGSAAAIDTRHASTIADENEQVRRELEELRAQAAEAEALRTRVAELELQHGGGGGSLPAGGLAAEQRGQGATTEPPHEGYDDLKADEAIKLARHEDTDDEKRQKLLEYERQNANRRTVVSALEQSIGS